MGCHLIIKNYNILNGEFSVLLLKRVKYQKE